MATRDQIQQAVDLLAELTDLPTLRVPLDDLAAWAECLGVHDMTVRLRYDNRVEATIARYRPDSGFVVYAVADLFTDHELPACPGDQGYGRAVRFPVGELARMESFGAVREGAAR